MFNRFEMRALIRRVSFAKSNRYSVLVVAPAAVGVACIAAIAFQHAAIAQVEKKGFVADLGDRFAAALQNPFAMLNARSPGNRGSGPQHLIKTAGGPHERVLAETREHGPTSGAPSAENLNGPIDGSPIAAASPNGLSGVPFSSGFPSTFSPFAGAFNTPNAFLPFENGGVPLSSSSGSPATPPITGIGNPDSHPPNGTSDPGSPSPPDITDTPPLTAPLPPETTGGGPPTIPVPEPASWSLLLFGVFVVAALRGWQKMKLAI